MRTTLEPRFGSPSRGVVLRKVIYAREKQEGWIEGLIDAVYHDSIAVSGDVERSRATYFYMSLMEFMVAFKRPDYAKEREARLVLWKWKEDVADSVPRYVAVPYRDGAGTWKEPFIGMELPVIDSARGNLSWEDQEFLRAHSTKHDKLFEPVGSPW